MVEPGDTRVKSEEGEQKKFALAIQQKNNRGISMQQNMPIEMCWSYSGE